MLNPTLARQRQQTLFQWCQQQGLDGVLISQPHHVYYYTAHRARSGHCAALVINAKGASTLICANQPAKNVAADAVIAYPANLHGTLRQDQSMVVAEKAKPLLIGITAIGFDSSDVAALVAQRDNHRCIDEAIWQARRVKQEDELAIMRRAIDATEAMYACARQMIQPGVREIDVYNQLHATAVETLAEPMTSMLGNDFACGVGGGPPRAGKAAQSGELYILDLGPAYQGYFADNARVISVDRKPTDAQQKAWQDIIDVFPLVESLAKPGVRCRDIYQAVNDHYQSRFGKPQVHHLGHGVGLQAHEFPHLNPEWDDTLLEGEVFTCEPGIYAPQLRGGLRIENQYLVTRSGVTNLTPFPLGLV
jgi:Xaa-Pro dipeptidase